MAKKPDITLRPASLKDAELLTYWDTKPHVIASDPNGQIDWKEELCIDPTYHMQFIAELNGIPIGFILIIDPANESSHYWGDVVQNLRAIDIWIGEETHLGIGYGTQMMHLAIDLCFSNPEVTAILIDPLESNVDAIRFYKRIGFQFLEKRRFEDDDCEVLQLSKDLYKK